MKATKQDYDVKFTSLPGSEQVASSMADMGRSMEQTERLVRRYRFALHQIAEAQKTAAVIAVQALRPGDWESINHTRKEAIRAANEIARKQALDVFSDYCTRGL